MQKNRKPGCEKAAVRVGEGSGCRLGGSRRAPQRQRDYTLQASSGPPRSGFLGIGMTEISSRWPHGNEDKRHL